MTRVLFLAASLGLAVSGAQACDFMKSAAKVDTSTTASVSTQDAADAADVDARRRLPRPQPATGDAVIVQQSE